MTAAHPQDSTAASSTLIGRERELALLRAALDQAFTGRGSLALIGGEAGIGKTTLVEALLAEATDRGALTLVGRCYDLTETPPYGPWRDLFARAPRDGELPSLPTTMLPPEAGGEPLASKDAIFRRVVDYLTSLAMRRPLVLLLDDLHWANPASLDLLRVIARGLAGLPILVIATYRSDEITRRHSLYALLPVLEREARATRLDLRRLDTAALGALVDARAALPEGDAARLVAWLQDRAEGNAFFTVQLLRALEDEGLLARANGHWALGDLGQVGLPAALRQVLDARLARLGEESQRLLAVAAVIGQEVPLALWAAIAETHEDGLMETVERAVDARLLAELPDGSGVRFAHALIREALYEGTLALRRRRVHLRAGEALAAASGPDPDATAYHFRQASDSRAAEWLVRAGERAWRSYAWLTAAERYELALALLEAQGADAGQRGWLLLILAQLRRYTHPQQGIAHLEEAERLAMATGDAVLAAAALFDQGHLRWLALDFRRGLDEQQAALAVLERLPTAERARLPTLEILGVAAVDREHFHRGALVNNLAHVGRFSEARRIGAPLVSLGSGRMPRGLLGLAYIYVALGQPNEAQRAFAAARAAYRAAEQHYEAGNILRAELQWRIVPYQADQPGERRRLGAEAEEAWTRASSVLVDLSPRLARLSMMLLEGDWAEARQLALATLVPTQRTEIWWHVARGILGPLARAQGEAGLAWRMVLEQFPGGPTTPLGEAMFFESLVLQRVAVDLALDANDLPLARSWLEAHDRWLAWSGAVLGQSEGQLAWAGYHRAAGETALARQHAEAALSRATEPRQPLALLAAHRLLGELDTAAGRHEDAAHHLSEALALAEACAAPYVRALTLLALTDHCLTTGDRDGARAALHEARIILVPLEARPALVRADALAARLDTPIPVAAAGLPFGLSAREAEVLQLVAQGLTDAQVAERLFLSPYTVKAHLRSIYSKTGVPSRTAAAHLAREHGLA